MVLAAPGRPIIETRSLTKTFGDQIALSDVDLSVSPGVIVGLIGPSGCGKTTLVKILTGITTATSGDVRVLGSDPATLTTAQRMQFGYMPQMPVLFPNLTVWGNLTFISSIYGLPSRGRRRRLMGLLELVDMAEHRKKLLAECSGGMQRRVALAATLVHDPALLYLDEPTAGVDPILRERFWAHFRDLRDAGKSLVVPTQYVGEAVSCDLVAVMAAGRMITVQPPGGLVKFAYGGDPLAVQLAQGWLSGAEITRVASADFVRDVRRTDEGLLVVVDDAERDGPRLVERLAAYGIATDSVERAEPTYDQVFVEVMSRHAAAEERRAA